MAKYEVPEAVLDKLKCGLCFEYLSHPPITLYAESGSVCGRCPALEPEKNIQPLREHTYESCANLLLLTFPCRYRSHGCLEKFTMKQMPLHEPSCSFRPYFCPVLPLGSCMWQGSPSELHGHFAMNHQIMLLENPVFELDLINNYKEHYLIPMLGQLFLLRVEYDIEQTEFCCSLHLVGAKEQSNKYQYEILVYTSENSNINTLVKKQVDLDVNILERITYSTFALEMIQNMFDNTSNIICKVKIISVFESMIVPLSLEDKDEEEEDFNSEEEEWNDNNKKAMPLIPDPANKMLFDIECPVCQEFMVPPIYQCIVGHSICAECKPKLKECPTCREKMGNTRNFTLEKITENLEYHCRNRFEGCEVVTSSCTIRNHESECMFKPHKCPYEQLEDCKWSGHLEWLMPHCKLQHGAKVQKDPFISMDYSIDVVSDEFKSIMQVFGKVFLLHFNYCNNENEVICAVQCYSSSTEAAKYMYEIQMIDLNNTKMQLTSKKYCCSIYDDIENIKFSTKWHLDMIRQFMLPDKIKYKCIIQRV